MTVILGLTRQVEISDHMLLQKNHLLHLFYILVHSKTSNSAVSSNDIRTNERYCMEIREKIQSYKTTMVSNVGKSN